MAITVPSVQITGTQEAIIRDNVENPDTNLGERALTQLVAPFRAATLARAEQAHVAAHSANHNAPLPQWHDKDGLIAWYLATDSYKDATQRAAVQRIAHIENELASLQSERSRHAARLAGLSGSSNSDLVTAVTETIGNIDGQIAALTAEKSALQQ